MYVGIVISPAHTSTAAMIGVTICIYRGSKCLQKYYIPGIQMHSPPAKVAARDIEPGVAVDAKAQIAETACAATIVVQAAKRMANTMLSATNTRHSNATTR